MWHRLPPMPDEDAESSDTDAPLVSADGIKLSAPWRLGDFVREGPLTGEQVADLSGRFDLDPDDVRRLSRALNRVLDRELETLAPMVRSTALARGRRRAGKAVRDIEAARARRMAAQAQLKGLVTEDEVGTVLMWGVNDGLHDCLRQLADALTKLEDVTRRPRGHPLADTVLILSTDEALT